MSGSRLGRGRVGRLVLLSCAAIFVIFLVYVYRTTSAEMARLKDLHVKCAQQQEALAAQLQVIYEYKVQLEKTLSNEKSANAAAKEELQQKASMERSLRDKDSAEAMQRYNALQQNYKQLKVEHQDLKDHCKDKEDVALENTKRLEDLRVQLKKADQDKDNLKNKLMQLANDKDQLEEKYSALRKTMSEDNGTVERLQKQVIQLQEELDETKNSPHFSVGGLNKGNSQVQPRQVNEASLNNDNPGNNKPAASANAVQVIRPSSQQQVSRPSDEFQGGQNPQPLQAPQNHRHLDNTDTNDSNGNNKLEANNNNKNDDSLPNEQRSDIRFESRNGNIVPVGPNDEHEQYAALPLPYEHQDKQKEAKSQEPADKGEEPAKEEDEQPKQVLAPPGDGKPESAKKDAAQKLSSNAPLMVPVLKPQPRAAAEQSAQVDSDVNVQFGDPNDFD